MNNIEINNISFNGYIKDVNHLKNYISKAIKNNNIDVSQVLHMDNYIEHLCKLDGKVIDDFTWMIKSDASVIEEDKFWAWYNNVNIYDSYFFTKEFETQTTKEFRKRILELKKTPGLYSFWTKRNTPLYIGMSANLCSRIPTSYKERFRVYSKEIYLKTLTGISASDAAVLETFFISKYKPSLNVIAKYRDKLTLQFTYDYEFSNPVLCNNIKTLTERSEP